MAKVHDQLAKLVINERIPTPLPVTVKCPKVINILVTSREEFEIIVQINESFACQERIYSLSTDIT